MCVSVPWGGGHWTCQAVPVISVFVLSTFLLSLSLFPPLSLSVLTATDTWVHSSSSLVLTRHHSPNSTYHSQGVTDATISATSPCLSLSLSLAFHHASYNYNIIIFTWWMAGCKGISLFLSPFLTFFKSSLILSFTPLFFLFNIGFFNYFLIFFSCYK